MIIYPIIENIFFVLFAVLCNVLAQISLKKASQVISLDFFNYLTFNALLTNSFVWLGVFLYGISFILTIKIYARFSLSIISPIMMGLIFIAILISSYFVFGEILTFRKFIGISIITLGMYIISK